MIQGFIEVSKDRYYGEVWPQIKQRVEAIQSNWEQVHNAMKTKLPHDPLLIYWGYKDPVTEQKIVLAIVQSKTKHIDQYWISPEITA